GPAIGAEGSERGTDPGPAVCAATSDEIITKESANIVPYRMRMAAVTQGRCQERRGSSGSSSSARGHPSTLCERIGDRAGWRHLTASHLQEVLADRSHQERLLRAADEEHWSVSRLREEVSKQRPMTIRSRQPDL